MDDFCSEDRQPTLAYRLGEEETPVPPPGEDSSQADTSPRGCPAQGGGDNPPAIDGYEIELPALGRGGMGVVYRARQVKLNRLVALKVLRHCDSARDALRFLREAELAARLPHAHIVQVYEVGSYRDRPDGPERPYIAFELIEGGGLHALLRETVLPPGDAALLVERLARTMQAVHARGIVHRDLKPANVLLADPLGNALRGVPLPPGTPRRAFPTGVPKITDFGLACLLEDGDSGLSRAGQLLGTPSYMAPEQIDGKRRHIGPAADIYALGAILYECLTGRPPFKGAGIRETLDLVCSQEAVGIRRLRPDVPRDLETICLKCLHKEPGRRYRNCSDLADDLARFQQGKPIHARPVSSLERAIRWCRRQPLPAALLAACLLLVVSLLVGGVWYASQLAAARTAAATAESDAAAAREVAATREYFALLHSARQSGNSLELDWTDKGLSAVRQAAALPTRVVNREELRGEAAGYLTGIDLRPQRSLHVGFRGSRMAFHPTRPLLAVGEAKGWFSCSVVLIDVSTGKVTRRLSLSSGRCWDGPRMAQDGVTALAFSPDGRWLLAGARSGAVHRWDLREPGETAKSWTAHGNRVRQVLFGQAVDVVFSASTDGMVKRWSILDGAMTHQIAASGPIAQGPDAGSLLLTDEHQVHLVDQSNLRPLRRPLPHAAHLAHAAGQGPVLLAHGNTLSLLDLESGRIAATLRHPGREEAHQNAITGICATADGLLLASSSAHAQRIRLWETASGRLLACLPACGVEQIEFVSTTNPAGAVHERTLAVLTDQEVHLHPVGGFDVEQFACLHAWPVRACALGKNGAAACIAGDRRTHQAELTFWSAGGLLWRRAATLPEMRRPVRLRADPKGEWLAYTEGEGLGIRPVARPDERLIVSPGEVHSLAFSADSQLWLAAGKRVEKRSLADGRACPVWDNALGDMITGLGNIWAVAPGRRHILAGGRDGCLRLLEPGSGKLLGNWKLDSAPILSVALSPDEQIGLVGTGKGTVHLLRLASGERIPLLGQHRDRVESVAFLGADLFATGSADHTLRLWRLDRGAARPWLTLNKPTGVRSLCALPDGKRLAVLLCGERAVRILDIERLRERLTRLGLD